MAPSRQPNMVLGIKVEHYGGQGCVSPRPYFVGGCITLSAGSPSGFSCYRDCLGYSHTSEQPTSNHGLKCENKSLTILAQCQITREGYSNFTFPCGAG